MNESGFGERWRLGESWAEAGSSQHVVPCDRTDQRGWTTDTAERARAESWAQDVPSVGNKTGVIPEDKTQVSAMVKKQQSELDMEQ